MQIYLPIAEIPVDIFTLLALGIITGILSGMFGVGGGFLMTPLLIFIGISPAVAVSSSANQIMAASFSGFLAHWRRNNVDFEIGILLLIGGIIGSSIGVWLFAILKNIGQIDLLISLTYVVFLGGVGYFMIIESTRSIFAKDKISKKKSVEENIFYKIPYFKRHFVRSDIHISALLPLITGFIAGMLVSIMGIGGGFIMIPAMIYILGMPTSIVIGTSLFQIIFTTANVTLLQALSTQTVDIVLSFILLVGSVIGAQIGTKIGLKLKAEHLRVMLAIMVLIVAFKLGLGLIIEPELLYTVDRVE
ncbi:MAG: sulfite exporter TauE/SafE family protein [Pseudomonadota bacterium]